MRQLAIGLIGILAFAGGVHAEPVKDAHVAAELVADAASTPGATSWAAVRLVVDPGWHVYWKNPGDSGLATSVRWTLPPGLEPAGELRWPAPRSFDEGPITNFGYSGEAWLLLPLRVSAAPAPGARLAADVEWLACQDVCLPGKAHLEAAFPPEAPRGEDVAAALAKLPSTESPWRVTASDFPERIVLRLDPPERGTAIHGVRFFPEDASAARHSATQFFRESQDGYYELTVPKAVAGASAPTPLKGVLVAKEGWNGPGSPTALEISIHAQSQGGDR